MTTAQEEAVRRYPSYDQSGRASFVAGTEWAQGARAEALRDLPALLGGWRELIAMLDDMPKDEAVGKAMWAALDQIDRVREQLGSESATTWVRPSEVEGRYRALEVAARAWFNAKSPSDEGEAITAMDRALQEISE